MNARRRPPLATDLHQPSHSSPTEKCGDFRLPVGNFRHQSDGSVLYHSIVRGIVLGDNLRDLDEIVNDDASFLASQP